MIPELRELTELVQESQDSAKKKTIESVSVSLLEAAKGDRRYVSIPIESLEPFSTIIVKLLEEKGYIVYDEYPGILRIRGW